MKTPPNPVNQQRSDEAQRRIQAAISELRRLQALPEPITARAKALQKASGVSFQTLYRYRHLWHPEHEPSVPVQETAE